MPPPTDIMGGPVGAVKTGPRGPPGNQRGGSESHLQDERRTGTLRGVGNYFLIRETPMPLRVTRGSGRIDHPRSAPAHGFGAS
jgi:hypothetical protein